MQDCPGRGEKSKESDAPERVILQSAKEHKNGLKGKVYMNDNHNHEKLNSRFSAVVGRISASVDRMTDRRMTLYAVVLLAVSLIPLLWLGRYNVMCIDDYDYGRQVHDTWLATGSYLEAVGTAWRQTVEFYHNWQGTYVSCFLMALCPMNFHYEIAWVVPVIMIGMFAISTFVLGRHIFTKWLGTDRMQSSFVMLLLLFMFYQVLEAPFEGIYWYNGSTHYILMQSVWFFTLAAISTALWADDKKREILYSILAAVLAVLVGGGNLITGLQAEIFMVLLLLYAFFTNRRKIWAVCLPFITGSAGFLCNTMAPGNLVRSTLDPSTGYSAIASIVLSFYYAVVFMIRWTPAFVMIIWLALLPVLWKMTKVSDKSFAHPVWVTAGVYCVISAMFTPTLYAVGMVGLSRVDNIIQMVYYLGALMTTAYWMGYFSHRKTENTAASALGSFLEKTGNRMTAACIFLVLVFWVLTADKNTYTAVSAARSLINGDAQTFYAEAMERHEVYVDENIVDVELQPYSARPALFTFDDLSTDQENWLNLAVMQYYHKAYVRLESVD